MIAGIALICLPLHVSCTGY